MNEISSFGVPCYTGTCSEIYREKAFALAGLELDARLPVAKELGETSMMFPVHPTLTTAHIDMIADTICRAVVNHTATRGVSQS